MDHFGDKVREARWRQVGRVLRRDRGFIGQRVLEMELPGGGGEEDLSEDAGAQWRRTEDCWCDSRRM